MILKRVWGETSDSLANPMGAERVKSRSQSLLGYSHWVRKGSLYQRNLSEKAGS